jgi:hypothetical protein
MGIIEMLFEVIFPSERSITSIAFVMITMETIFLARADVLVMTLEIGRATK